MDEVRIGIIGMGKMARLAMRVFMESHLTRVVAFSARRQEVVDQVSVEFGLPGYVDYRKMLERSDIDAIVVATPDNWHFEFAHAALESGRHVFVEKPFTTSVKEADILLRLAHQKNRKIQVAFNHRWLSAYYTAHKTISSGDIGVPITATRGRTIPSSSPPRTSAGQARRPAAWLLSSHDIDLVRWFLGSEPVEARAYGRRSFCRRWVYRRTT